MAHAGRLPFLQTLAHILTAFDDALAGARCDILAWSASLADDVTAGRVSAAAIILEKRVLFILLLRVRVGALLCAILLALASAVLVRHDHSPVDDDETHIRRPGAADEGFSLKFDAHQYESSARHKMANNGPRIATLWNLADYGRAASSRGFAIAEIFEGDAVTSELSIAATRRRADPAASPFDR